MRTLASLAVAYALVVAVAAPAALLAADAGQPGEESLAAPQSGAPPAPGPGPPQDPSAAPAEPRADADQPGGPLNTPSKPSAAPVPSAAEKDAPRARERAAAPEAAPAPAETAPEARAAAPGSVTIKDFSFGPASITVTVGDTVTWTNAGPTPHSATAGDGSFDTGVFDKGQSRSHTFAKAGEFAYLCTPHPNMKGRVRVLAASQGGGEEDSGSSPAGSEPSSPSRSGQSTVADPAAAEGPQLPATGSPAWALALLGLILLSLGVAARSRTSRD